MSAQRAEQAREEWRAAQEEEWQRFAALAEQRIALRAGELSAMPAREATDPIPEISEQHRAEARERFVGLGDQRFDDHMAEWDAECAGESVSEMYGRQEQLVWLHKSDALWARVSAGEDSHELRARIRRVEALQMAYAGFPAVIAE
ncbi:hypothetical protein [Actinacidiphila oryziradicis]|uniref:Uncharacterized protein n=1 Tax=Actinacidiphila oryziradicis TaxID=2571141 RepID=A0A4V6WJD1_9ACTN|nr:hypothetical protein [Actinacidiphila oryziradicis]TKA13169.1 hypothetical protein FCI23_00015 [Actinacidiphila oryziradicis]